MIQPYYQDDYATIYHGDCREILHALEKVDLVLTDPPYGIGESSRKVASREKLAKPKDYGAFSWDNAAPDARTLQLVIEAGTHAILWGGNFFGLPASSKWLVWDKDNSGDFADCELAWTNLPGAVRKFKWRWNGMLQEDMGKKETRFHPTQKPLPLMAWCLKQANAPKLVIDPYMGSGTTLRAAKNQSICSIGIDADERYCEIAAERLRQEVFDFFRF